MHQVHRHRCATGPTGETRLDAFILSSEFFPLPRGFGWILEELRAPARRWFTARRERGEKSKITPEALPFPPTRRRDNVPPLRFVDGWATDAARRKIERNKKNARRGPRTTIRGEKAKNRSILSPRQHQFYFYYRRSCLSFSLSFSSSLSLSITSSGFVIGRRRCNRWLLLLLSVYARSNNSSDRAWLFFHSSSPLSHARSLCIAWNTFSEAGQTWILKRNAYLKHII